MLFLRPHLSFSHHMGWKMLSSLSWTSPTGSPTSQGEIQVSFNQSPGMPKVWDRAPQIPQGVEHFQMMANTLGGLCLLEVPQSTQDTWKWHFSWAPGLAAQDTPHFITLLPNPDKQGRTKQGGSFKPSLSSLCFCKSYFLQNRLHFISVLCSCCRTQGTEIKEKSVK